MRLKKYTKFLTIVFLCMLCTCGCKRNTTVDDNLIDSNNDKVITQPVVEPTATIAPIDELDEEEQKDLSIYSMDSATAEKKPVTAVVSADEKITPEMIVDMVVESMADETFMIGIDSVTTSEDTVIVSFKNDQPPVTNVGASVESEILDAIAMSLLENLSNDYHKVVFRVMGDAYCSGHLEFEKDHVYLEVH